MDVAVDNVEREVDRNAQAFYDHPWHGNGDKEAMTPVNAEPMGDFGMDMNAAAGAGMDVDLVENGSETDLQELLSVVRSSERNEIR